MSASTGDLLSNSEQHDLIRDEDIELAKLINNNHLCKRRTSAKRGKKPSYESKYVKSDIWDMHSVKRAQKGILSVNAKSLRIERSSSSKC